MAVRVVDYSPLTASVTPRDVAAWRAQAKASGAQWASVNVSTVVTIVVGCVVALIFLNVVVGTVTTASLSNGAGAASTIVMVLIYTGIAAIVAVRLRARFVRGGRWTRWLRLSRSGQRNDVLPSARQPQLPG